LRLKKYNRDERDRQSILPPTCVYVWMSPVKVV